ncbi:MAG: hypothetical protein A2189_04220 [Paenibacillus sp. RIFOXYA1_FULL_44_5]|nr:MAG: hypothetical protein A2189_04220 [Paenibacillus sp. RIFOXYA1_FULL_44_5]
MTRVLVVALSLVVIAVSGCGPSQTTASWAFNAINWHHRIYRVTSQVVSSVGNQISSVTNFSQSEETPEAGTFSNYFPVGTKIFLIPGVDDSKAIAIETANGTFVKAILDHSY